MRRTPLELVIAIIAFFSAIAFATAGGMTKDDKACDSSATPVDERVVACTRALKASNDGSWKKYLYVERAEAYEKKGMLELALQDLAAAIKSDPKSSWGYYNRGWLHYRLDNPEAALSDFSRATDIEPKDGFALYGRAGARVRTGDFERALADLREAETTGPDEGQLQRIRHVRIMAFISMGEFDQAIGLADKIVQEKPGNVEIARLKVVALIYKADYKRALADAEALLRLNPEKADGYARRASLREHLDDRDGAQSDYETALRLEPNSIAALTGQSGFWRRQSLFERAATNIEKAIALSPNDASVLAERAELSLAQGNLDRAASDAEKAAKSDRLTGVQTRSEVRYLSGDLAGAIEDLNLVLRAFPNSVEHLTRRGLAYEKRGETSRAISDFKRAVSAHGGFKEDIAKAQAVATSRLGILVPNYASPAQGSSALAVLKDVPGAKPAKDIEAASKPFPSTKSGNRVALVIGNSAYKSVPLLPNPTRDANEIARSLREVGFQSVTLGIDLTREKMIDVVRRFTVEADNADWAVVYFAGHGIEVNGMNYLIPVDAGLATDRDVQFEAVSLEQVMSATEGARKLRLVLLDACRDNPFANQIMRSTASRSIGRGLARVEPDSGTLVVYAAKHGQVALDGNSANSPFVTAFLNRVKTPKTEIRKLFDLVRDDVMAATGRRQQPFSYGSVPGSEDFYFLADAAPN